MPVSCECALRRFERHLSRAWLVTAAVSAHETRSIQRLTRTISRVSVFSKRLLPTEKSCCLSNVSLCAESSKPMRKFDIESQITEQDSKTARPLLFGSARPPIRRQRSDAGLRFLGARWSGVDPLLALQDRSCERAGSARKRTLAEDVGWAESGRWVGRLGLPFPPTIFLLSYGSGEL